MDENEEKILFQSSHLFSTTPSEFTFLILFFPIIISALGFKTIIFFVK